MNDALPDAVDERLVPRRGAGIHTVELDGEAVLHDEEDGRLHLLNATGALLWACFDGTSSIGEIVSDISDELGVPYQEALADALALARKLGDQGVVANVRPATVEEGGVEIRASEPVEAADPRFVPEPPNP
jgi:Coenzyme PQQ synthesis protein D (PqqD)